MKFYNQPELPFILSVIICTWNPRFDYLERVLFALRYQSLPYRLWELIVIDNASDTILASKLDLSWHPHACLMREEQLGLTKARIRGIQEARGEVLVFVDDDNVLQEDFLEITLRISKDYSLIGAWGGQVKLEFEQVPPEWTKPYWNMLAWREFDRDMWSNLHHGGTLPAGAGLCVRKAVAQKYVELVRQFPQRAKLDRIGNSLTSAGDSDLALTACDIGLGTGQFKDLRLIHLIPPVRLQEDYLLRLTEAMYYSGTILSSFRGHLPRQLSWKARLLQFCRYLLIDEKSRRFNRAVVRGIARAKREILDSYYQYQPK